MGFRFRRSFKIAPGLKLNLGKKSTSLTMGGKGLHYTVSSTGRRTASAGIPGTGLSYTTTTQSKKKQSRAAPKADPVPAAVQNVCPSPADQPESTPEMSPQSIAKKCCGCGLTSISLCLSIFLFLCTLVYLPSMASLLFLVAGVVLLPVPAIQNFLRKVFLGKRSLKAASAAILFVVGAMISPAADPPPTEPIPSVVPTAVISCTAEPTAVPTVEPTAVPTIAPTAEPTPTVEPTPTPTAKPTPAPTKNPAVKPAEQPAAKPAENPAPAPAANPDANSVKVWIPTNGGKKYHSRPGCSNMKNPKEVTQEEAIRQGFGPCKRCYG